MRAQVLDLRLQFCALIGVSFFVDSALGLFHPFSFHDVEVRSVSTTKDRAQLLHCALISSGHRGGTWGWGFGRINGSMRRDALCSSTNKNKSTDRSRNWGELR